MSRNPDIQRLLANLRGGILNDNFQVNATSAQDHPLTDNVELQRSTLPAEQPLKDRRQQSAETHAGSTEATVRESSTSRSSTPNTPDASSIVTWPSAVKFISKHIAPNAIFEAKVKQLITDQHKYERDWWNKRETIVNRHAGRAGNQQKAAELLRALGGQYVPVAPSDPEADVAELESFDAKVHKSLMQLAAHYDSELRAIGIPFFAIKHELVVREADQNKKNTPNGRLSQSELKGLQKRMLTYLEELFGDETAAG